MDNICITAWTFQEEEGTIQRLELVDGRGTVIAVLAAGIGQQLLEIDEEITLAGARPPCFRIGIEPGQTLENWRVKFQRSGVLVHPFASFIRVPENVDGDIPDIDRKSTRLNSS